MKKRILAIISIIMCTAILFSACGKKNSENNEEIIKKLASDENLAAYVGDVPVTWADYNLLYRRSYNECSQYEASYGAGWYNAVLDDNGTTMGEYMKQTTENLIVELIAAEKLAEEKGIKIDEEIKASAEKEISAIKESRGGEDGFKSFLEEYHTTEEAVIKYFQRVALYKKVVDKVAEEEFLNRYIRVKHILISFEGGKSEEETLNTAKKVVAELNDGADFDSLIEKYDEDPGMEPGGYYTFTDKEMVVEFETESKKLKEGKYTKKPVRTDFGYHIIKRYGVTTDCPEFDDFKDGQVNQEAVGKMIDAKMDSLHVEKKGDEINKSIESWLTELGVDIAAKPDNAVEK